MTGSFPSWIAFLDRLVGLEVVAGLDGSAQTAVRHLLLVLVLDLGVVERAGLDRDLVALRRRPRLVGGNQQVRELDLQEVVLPLAGLADDKGAFLDVLAAGAGLQQLGGRLVDLHGEVKVLHGDFARAAAAAAGMGTGLRLTPGEREHVDPVLVLVVLALAGDPLNLEKHVNSHWLPSFE